MFLNVQSYNGYFFVSEYGEVILLMVYMKFDIIQVGSQT